MMIVLECYEIIKHRVSVRYKLVPQAL